MPPTDTGTQVRSQRRSQQVAATHNHKSHRAGSFAETVRAARCTATQSVVAATLITSFVFECSIPLTKSVADRPRQPS